MSSFLLIAAVLDEDIKDLKIPAIADITEAMRERLAEVSGYDDDLDDDTIDLYLGRAEAALNTLHGGGDKMTTWIDVKGVKVWLAGGPSLGDTPNDAYDNLAALSAVIEMVEAARS
jgi:hypothetical protein